MKLFWHFWDLIPSASFFSLIARIIIIHSINVFDTFLLYHTVPCLVFISTLSSSSLSIMTLIRFDIYNHHEDYGDYIVQVYPQRRSSGWLDILSVCRELCRLHSGCCYTCFTSCWWPGGAPAIEFLIESNQQILYVFQLKGITAYKRSVINYSTTYREGQAQRGCV